MRVLIIILTSAAAVLVAMPASAAVQICVDVKADKGDVDSLRKLVVSEIGRHPSHEVVETHCRSRLTVELFTFEGERYLTARIGGEVPVRYRVKGDEGLSEALAKGISLVLGSDPVYLTEDITRYSLAQRAVHSVVKKGTNIWRIELFETLARGGGHLAFASGGSVAVTRGAGHFSVFARVYFSGWPGSLSETDPALRISTGADVGLTYELSALGSTTFYISLGAGLQYLRYEGRVVEAGHSTVAHIDEILPVLLTRIGVRFFRLHDFDCDLFASGYLPLFSTNDPDSLLFGDDGLYTPSIQAGMGVGF